MRQRQGKLLEELDLSGWHHDPQNWQIPPDHSWWNTMMSFCRNQANWAVPILPKHIIKIMDDTPFKEQFWWIPPPLVEEVHSPLWEMDSGTIWHRQSVWCNAVVLVRKNWGLCFCIDFCPLNVCMKKDSYPLPRIQEALESLVGAGHFSCLDLKLGFWQIKMKEAFKQYTVFTVGNLGFFECNRMPFWLCSAPATFQRLMQNCLSELNLIYLDDIVIFLQVAEDHLHWLWVVLDQFGEYNVKLKLSKCSFFQREDHLPGT